MIPRTVLMAQAVAAQFTPTQLDDYGNIILNGYAYSNPAVATAGAVGALDTVTITSPGSGFTDGTYTGVYLSSDTGTFAYADVVVAGGVVTTVTVVSGGQRFAVGQYIILGNLPAAAGPGHAILQVAQVNQNGVRPALKGWSTNYNQFYTQLPPNGYGVNPGDPTGFEYTVHSYTPLTGPIASIGGHGTWVYGGKDYTPGFYSGIALSGGSGAGAVASFAVTDIIEVEKGPIYAFTQTEPGQGYVPISPAPLPISATGIGFDAVFAGAANVGSPYNMTITGLTNPGYNYSVGDYLDFPGGSRVIGTPPGSSLDAIVQVDTVGYYGVVSLVTLDNPGTGYKVGDVLTAALPGGAGLSLPVGSIASGPHGGGEPRWAQPPHRFYGQGYSFTYPVADNPVAPPIGVL